MAVIKSFIQNCVCILLSFLFMVSCKMVNLNAIRVTLDVDVFGIRRAGGLLEKLLSLAF